MADWRQIQARIRKARTSADPIAKLNELYLRTHDAMVAWELGAVEEKGGRSDEAVKWYKVATEKFRRADWKKKAEEALTRMGVNSPEQDQPSEPEAVEKEVEPATMTMQEARPRPSAPLALGEVPEREDVVHEAEDAESEEDEISGNVAVPAEASASGTAADTARKKRRRGRRGGRGRRRKGGPNGQGLPSQAYTPAASAGPSHVPSHAQPRSAAQPFSAASSERECVPYEQPSRKPQPEPHPEPVHRAPQLPSERAAHGRSDPGLSSRMAQLESLLRRLLNSPLHRLGEADEAPAGPGVFLISDSDQTTSYYIEACQTLRVGVGNVGRGVRSQKGNRSGSRNFSESNFKERFAEHLGINEAKVSQYMKDHCVVRWIQLDDEASNLAHFAIGVLRTPLNSD